MRLACAAGRRGMGVAFLAACVVSLLPGDAGASHYDLSSIDLVDEAMVGRMAALGIATTEDLWRAAESGRPATTLARRLAVPATQVRAWRAFCDLLRLDGVGPKVARVLTAAGIKDLKAVAKQQPEALSERIQQVNQGLELLGKTPEVDTVRAWITQAQERVQEDAAAGKRARKKGKPVRAN